MVIFNNILFLTFFILKHFLKLEDENWAGTWWKSVRLWKTWLGRLWTCLPYFWAVKVGNISCNLKEVVLRQIPKDRSSSQLGNIIGYGCLRRTGRQESLPSENGQGSCFVYSSSNYYGFLSFNYITENLNPLPVSVNTFLPITVLLRKRMLWTSLEM